MSNNNIKRRTHATHHGGPAYNPSPSSSASLAAPPPPPPNHYPQPHTTTIFNVPTHQPAFPAQTIAPPSGSGSGMYYNPEAYLANPHPVYNEKSPYHFVVTQPAPPYSTHPFPNWNQDLYADHSQPIQFQSYPTPPQQVSSVVVPPSTSDVPTMVIDNVAPFTKPGLSTLRPCTSAGADPLITEVETQQMDQDIQPASPTASPPGSPGSIAGELPPTSPVPDGRRTRDKHRKDIENRAAQKRKTAVKRLQRVLADRTHGLPENGLANQLHMAADQLEEDGKLIRELKNQHSGLQKRTSELEKRNAALQAENAELKRRISN